MGTNRQDIANMVEKMPAFPKSVHRVMELSADINCNPRDLVEVIEQDPVLILKILKLVNSVYFGLSEKITSVNHAVAYIGLNTVKNLALSTAAVGMLPHRNEAGFNMDAFLLHSISTATIAKMFARKMKIESKESFDYFLSGLLHDFGKVVFAHFMPHEFHKALHLAKEKGMPLYEAENEIFSIDHTQIGFLLGEKWQLPSNLVESLQGHHYRGGSRSILTGSVAAANLISKELKMGDSGCNLVESFPDELIALFGTDVNVVIGALGEVKSEIEKAMVFSAL